MGKTFIRNNRLSLWFSGLLACALLAGCHRDSPDTLIVGTISGPETELVQVASEVAKKQAGLHIKIVEFNDFNRLNTALNDGSLDANVYQHLPYLQVAIEVQHYDLAVMGKTFIYPTGIYSKKIHRLSKLADNALIAIPNDPSNETRALRLLEQAGLIKLKNATGMVSETDIVQNEKHLRFKAMDAAQLPRVLPDVDAAIINTTFAIPAGLKPQQDALILENKNSPYVNLIVIRRDSKKKIQLEQFVHAFQSPEVKEKADALFGGAAIPGW